MNKLHSSDFVKTPEDQIKFKGLWFVVVHRTWKLKVNWVICGLWPHLSWSSPNEAVLPFSAKRLLLNDGQSSDRTFICLDGAPPSKSQAPRAPRLLVLDTLIQESVWTLKSCFNLELLSRSSEGPIVCCSFAINAMSQ